uniref:Uncharacterized protein n=1 Tax=Romanomermis culicivorax TaxID=13658 RepID=A0A915JIM5_ROMCU
MIRQSFYSEHVARYGDRRLSADAAVVVLPLRQRQKRRCVINARRANVRVNFPNGLGRWRQKYRRRLRKSCRQWGRSRRRHSAVWRRRYGQIIGRARKVSDVEIAADDDDCANVVVASTFFLLVLSNRKFTVEIRSPRFSTVTLIGIRQMLKNRYIDTKITCDPKNSHVTKMSSQHNINTEKTLKSSPATTISDLGQLVTTFAVLIYLRDGHDVNTCKFLFEDLLANARFFAKNWQNFAIFTKKSCQNLSVFKASHEKMNRILQVLQRKKLKQRNERKR